MQQHHNQKGLYVVVRFGIIHGSHWRQSPVVQCEMTTRIKDASIMLRTGTISPIRNVSISLLSRWLGGYDLSSHFLIHIRDCRRHW
jgi:hypothetical protein